MQLVNIRPVSQYVPGDLTEVPDGAAYSEFHWAPPAADDPPASLPAAAVPITAAAPAAAEPEEM